MSLESRGSKKKSSTLPVEASVDRKLMQDLQGLVHCFELFLKVMQIIAVGLGRVKGIGW